MLYTNKMNNNKTFSYLYKKGKCIISRHIVIYVKKTNRPYNNLGITAGKKVGNAVHRNRAKRVIRAAYTACEAAMPIGVDMVIVARASVCNVKSTALEKYLREKGIKEIVRAVTKQGDNGK